MAHQLHAHDIVAFVVEAQDQGRAATAGFALSDFVDQAAFDQLGHDERDRGRAEASRPYDVGSRCRPGAEHVKHQVAVHVYHQLAVAPANALAR